MELKKASCPSCNASIDPTSRKCPYCNTIFANENDHASAKTDEVFNSVKQNEVITLAKSKPKKRFNNYQCLAILGLAIIVIIIGSVIIDAIVTASYNDNYIETDIISADFAKTATINSDAFKITITTNGIFKNFKFVVNLEFDDATAQKNMILEGKKKAGVYVSYITQDELTEIEPTLLLAEIENYSLTNISGTVFVHKKSYILPTDSRAWINNKSPYKK